MFIEVNWDYDDVLLDIRIAGKILGERPTSEEELRNNVLSELSLLAPTKPDLPHELSTSDDEDEYEGYDESTTGVGVLEAELNSDEFISEAPVTDSDKFDKDCENLYEDSDEDDNYENYDEDGSVNSDNYDIEEELYDSENEEEKLDVDGFDNEINEIGSVPDINIVQPADVISRYSFSDIPKNESVTSETKVIPVTPIQSNVVQSNRTDEIPKTLVEYLRKYPKSEISDVLKYFTQADIDKHLRIGAICRSKNKLYI